MRHCHPQGTQLVRALDWFRCGVFLLKAFRSNADSLSVTVFIKWNSTASVSPEPSNTSRNPG